MSEEKRRCPNCGAYLKKEDNECYVCGEILEPAGENFSEPKKKEKPADANVYYPTQNLEERNGEERYNLSEQETESISENEFSRGDIEYSDPYNDEEDYDRPRKKSGSKKVAIICGICVGVVAIVAAIVCVCWFNGVFGGNNDEKYTVYFDKPSVNLNLMDENGEVYNWGADVELSYTDKKGEEQTVVCSPVLEYDNLWSGEVPADAEQVYFYASGDVKLKTQVLPELLDKQVYYVTQILCNSELEFPVASCSLNEFDNFGVNATEETGLEATTEETTEQPTKKETEPESTKEETTEPTTAPTTSADSGQDRYTISVPSAWTSGATVIEKGNCTTYYESYNYKNYQSGMLLSIYVYDANDNSYGDMNVKKVMTTSDGKKQIVVVTPSDVEFNDSDETAAENYIALSNLSNQVISSIKAK